MKTAIFVLAAATSAVRADSAGTLDTTDAFTGNGYQFDGQSFVVPDGDDVVSTMSLMLHNDSGAPIASNFTLSTYDADFGGPATTIFSAPFTLPTGDQLLEIVPAGITVAPGEEYVLGVDLGSAQDHAGTYFSADYYSEGSAIFVNADTTYGAFDDYDAAFNVTFSQVPEPASLCMFATALLLRRRRH